MIEQSGGCVCGSIRFLTQGLPSRITVCHCLWCQKRTGTAFGVEAVFDRSKVAIEGSSLRVHRHRSDESMRWLDMHFCSDCGTNLGLTLEVRADIRSIPMGVFDNPTWLDEQDVEVRHVYTRSQRHWGDIDLAIKTYPGYFE